MLMHRIKQGILILLAAVCARFGWEIAGAGVIGLWNDKALPYFASLRAMDSQAMWAAILVVAFCAAVIYFALLLLDNMDRLVIGAFESYDALVEWWEGREKKREKSHSAKTGGTAKTETISTKN